MIINLKKYFLDWDIAYIGVKNNWLTPNEFLTFYDFNAISKFIINDDFISLIFSNYEINKIEFLKLLHDYFNFSREQEEIGYQLLQLIILSEIINSKKSINEKLNEISQVWPIFGYPKNWETFINYMPSTVPNSSSDTLFSNFLIFFQNKSIDLNFSRYIRK